MILRGSCGWPIERIKGRRVVNFIRVLLHTDIGVTWQRRREGWPTIRCEGTKDRVWNGLIPPPSAEEHARRLKEFNRPTPLMRLFEEE